MALEADLSTGSVQDNLFGILAVRCHFVLAEQVEEALFIQRELQQSGKPVPRLGEILTERGYITAAQVQDVLKGQTSDAMRLFGELAVALRFCQRAEVDAALAVQEQIKACGSHQRLGEILVARGALRPHQVHAVLREQGQAGHAESSGTRPAVGQPAPAGSISRLANAVIGQYQLGQKLGSDSSGVLYKAFAPRTGTTVALRMLNSATVRTREASEHWLSAGEAASELTHPNLQRILEINSDAGRVFLAMEFVEGESLRLAMARRGKLPVLETLDVLIQIAEAIAYGHERGFLHGDLRPAHVLIGFDGIVRVSGLGTPKNVSQNLRQVAQQLGEEALPLYTPPEVMIDDEHADQRSDIYSLGAIGYHLLTGRPPHEGVNVLQLGLKIASENLRPPRELEPSIPLYLSRLLCKCLQPEPDDRYDSASALLDDLRKARQAFFTGVPDVAEIAPPPPPQPAGRGRPFLPRPRDKSAASASRHARLRTHIARGAHGAARPAASGARLKSPAPRLARPATHAAPPVKVPRAPTAAPVAATIAIPQSATTEAPADDADALLAELMAEEREEAVAAEAAGKPQKHQGKPLDPGVSTKAVLIGTGVTVVVVAVLVIAMSRTKPAPAPAVEAPKPKVEAPIAAAPSDPRASQDWRIVKDYITANPKDHLGIVQRIEVFKRNCMDGLARQPEQAQAAMDLLKEHCALGIKATQPELREAVQKLLDADKFAEADNEVKHWAERWRWDPQAADISVAMRIENAEKQKQTAESRMAEALRLRKDKKWDEALALYKTLLDNFAESYRTAALRARSDTRTEAEASLGQAERETRARKAADEKAARETAAPARLQQLAADVEAALKTFDLDQCKRALDHAAEQLAGTPQDAEAKEVRDDYKRLAALRERIVTGSKTSKFSVPPVVHRGQTCVIIKFTERGPMVQAGAGQVALNWSELRPDDLAELARRASDNESGAEMLEYGALLYFLGKPYEAKIALAAAQRLGATVTRYLPKVEAQLKDAVAKAQQEAAATKEAKDAKEKEAKDKETAAAAGTAAPATEADVTKALAAENLEVRFGIWKLTADGIMQAIPNAASANPNLVSLKRALQENFKSIAVEVRGTGEMAGLSFGEGRRFSVAPAMDWQKLVLERGDKIVFKVNGEARESLEPIAKDVNADTLVTEGAVYLRLKGTKAEFRNLVVEE